MNFIYYQRNFKFNFTCNHWLVYPCWFVCFHCTYKFKHLQYKYPGRISHHSHRAEHGGSKNYQNAGNR